MSSHFEWEMFLCTIGAQLAYNLKVPKILRCCKKVTLGIYLFSVGEILPRLFLILVELIACAYTRYKLGYILCYAYSIYKERNQSHFN